MTLGQLARMSGRGALVLRKMEMNETGPNYVHIVDAIMGSVRKA